MKLLSKYNNNNLNPFNYEQVPSPEYKRLADLYEEGTQQILVHGFFINNKGKFGDSAVAMAEGYNINLPNHLRDTVKEMIQDPDIVELANEGRLGIEIYSYNSKKWGKNYSANFVELSDLPF